MKSYQLDLEDVAFSDSSMNVLNGTLSEFERFDSRLEPAALSTSELVDLFLEYRKRVGAARKQAAGPGSNEQ